MKDHSFLSYAARTSAAVLIAVSAADCSGMRLWPFGDAQAQPRSRTPANATAYQCGAGKRFYVRSLDNGAAAWLILPEREVRLEKVPGAGNATRYSNGAAVLEINGNQATLTDGALAFTGCSAAAS